MKKDSQVIKVARKTDIDALEMYDFKSSMELSDQ